MSRRTVPMRPNVRLRVGVTGHRPGPKLPDEAHAAIAKTVRRVFEALSTQLPPTMADLRWAFGPDEARLGVVSSLAEGADRIVAEAGLGAGASLEVVLPSTRAVYEEDFETEASKIEFRDLVARAQSVFELDRPGGRLDRKRGYEAAGLVMLAHTDILIAVWDEGEAAGIGGTANIVAQAVIEGAPVFLINPNAPDRVRLLWIGDLDLPPSHVRIEDLPERDALLLAPKVLLRLDRPAGRRGRARRACAPSSWSRPSTPTAGRSTRCFSGSSAFARCISVISSIRPATVARRTTGARAFHDVHRPIP